MRLPGDDWCDADDGAVWTAFELDVVDALDDELLEKGLDEVANGEEDGEEDDAVGMDMKEMIDGVFGDVAILKAVDAADDEKKRGARDGVAVAEALEIVVVKVDGAGDADSVGEAERSGDNNDGDAAATVVYAGGLKSMRAGSEVVPNVNVVVALKIGNEAGESVGGDVVKK